MTRIGQQAPYLDGIKVVASSTERDSLFPAPDTNQRVENAETGYVERWDGANWLADFPIVSAGPVINVLSRGAKGDGSTDDSDAWSNAIADLAALGGGILDVPYTASGHVINHVQVTNSNIWVRVHPSVSVKRTAPGVAAQGMLEFMGAQTATSTTLSSSAALGATSLSVVSESGFAAGDWIEMESSLLLGIAPYLYEINRVDSVSAGVINLKWTTRNAYSTSGATVTVHKLSALSNVGVSGGIWTGPGDVGNNVLAKWCIGPITNRVKVTNHGQQGIIYQRVFGGSIRDSESYAGVTTGSHGIALYSTEGVLVDRCVVRDATWDGYDLANGAMYNTIRASRAINVGDVGFVVGHGQHGHHNLIEDCVAVRCGTGGFQMGDPSYESDEDNELRSCRAIGTQSDGFKLKIGSTRNKLVRCVSVGSTSHGFSTDTTSVDNDLIECEGRSSTNHGASIQARTRVVGGHYDSNTGNGIRVTGSTAADTVLDGVNAKGNTLDNIAILSSAARTLVRNPVVENAGTSHHGILVQTSCPDVRIVEPVCRNNAGWGVLIIDSAGDCARSRVVGGFFTGNGSGTANANNAAEQSADNGDTSPTITVDTSAPIQRFDTVLTANRTCTLSRTNVRPGARFRIVRTGLGAFTLTVQDATGPTTLKVIPNSTAAYVDAEFNNSAWVLIGYGTL